ncbi:MAG TPA: GNAT family N-acetyltransferase [Spirochaetota bacterium]|nr:GNAT family N-acetyltransferase [Spirochaetota bacterium]OPZ36871.1 MAG: Acetyltransferase (GNAT) family protein [Spirochaetes bacterium ADurb.BinA120]HNU90542.1 GNAT family N-acetyltransferase [Spirochaetota bacterium]
MSSEPRMAAAFRTEIRPSDPPGIRRIVESSNYFSPAEIEIAVELAEERIARGDASGYHFLFADGPSGLMGYACFGPIPATESSYDLYWIAVDSLLRGSGLGRELLERSERIVAGMGGRRLYIDTSSREQYVPTHGFYLRCGYRQEAFLEDFYSPGDGKLIYVKALSDVRP